MDDLEVRVQALADALRERDAQEARLRVDRTATREEISLVAAEHVLSRRSGLYRSLIRNGWTPPSTVVRHLLEDDVLLGEPVGEAGG